MSLTPLERERIAWTDFRLLSSDIREQVVTLGGDWEIRFKGTVASDLGLFENDYAAAEQDAQARYLSEQQQRGLTHAKDFAELAQSLQPHLRRELEAQMHEGLEASKGSLPRIPLIARDAWTVSSGVSGISADRAYNSLVCTTAVATRQWHGALSVDTTQCSCGCERDER